MTVSDIIIIVTGIRASMKSEVLISIDTISEGLHCLVLSAAWQESFIKPGAIRGRKLTMHIKEHFSQRAFLNKATGNEHINNAELQQLFFNELLGSCLF